jgi:isopentenyl-diphosphate delta-isomerase
MGLSYTDGMKLKNIGVKYVETGGAGGTSWVGVETLRSEGVDRAIGNMLWDFGIPTAVSTAWMVDAGLNVISSGGIRDSVDIARAISLGANMTAMARPLLKAFASDFENGLDNKLEELITGLKYVMMCTGCKTIEDLKSVSTVRGSKLSHYIETGWTS